MKKRTALVSVILAACILLAAGVGVTVAYLVSKSLTLDNTFTLGNVGITLTETPTEGYMILPGAEIPKDPTVTVKGGSDACWLFFKAEASSDFGSYMTYSVAEGWTPLEGEPNVYYRSVEKTVGDLSFGIIRDNSVSVRETVTEEELGIIHNKPTLSFRAYAVQRAEISSAEEAWDILKEEQLNEAT